MNSDRMTINLPRGNNKLSCEWKATIAVGQSLPRGSSLPQVHVNVASGRVLSVAQAGVAKNPKIRRTRIKLLTQSALLVACQKGI